MTEMLELELDGAGYPTEESLERLRTWPPSDFGGAWDALRSVWRWETYIDAGPDAEGLWTVSTGGWSGHEDMLGALEQNYVWWGLHWYASRRGGHYQFKPYRAEPHKVLEPGTGAREGDS